MVPARPWGRTTLLAVALVLAATVAWELHWRRLGFAVESVRNSEGLWAAQRRLAVAGDGRATVIVGSSRVLFDVDLATWAEVVGSEPPIQLALEGTPPRQFVQDLAADPKFRGFLVIGYTAGLFFAPFDGERGDMLRTFERQTPSERFGHHLSMLLEPRFAFLEDDARLRHLLDEAPWPARPGLPPSRPQVPRLAEFRPSREALMWSKVEHDPAYRERVRNVWLALMNGPGGPLPEEKLTAMMRKMAEAVTAIRARGGQVLFVRCPATGPWLDFEAKVAPREKFWDRLLAETDSQGISFEDHPELREGYELPEWSHLRAADRVPFTRNLAKLAAPIWRQWRATVEP